MLVWKLKLTLDHTHLLSRVDVQTLVQVLLEVGHHGVVPRHPVDPGVVQARGLHHTAAHLHDQGDKLPQNDALRWRSRAGRALDRKAARNINGP